MAVVVVAVTAVAVVVVNVRVIAVAVVFDAVSFVAAVNIAAVAVVRKYVSTFSFSKVTTKTTLELLVSLYTSVLKHVPNIRLVSTLW